MDTTTHTTVGIGLAGLAYLDPVIPHYELTSAILLCTMLGSNAPDLDYIYRYKDTETYLKQHRGKSHSVPAVFILTFIISMFVSIFFGFSHFFTYFFWTFVAVVLHVGFDVCNIYGTQALLPFKNKWYALHILPIFDPFIMFSHLVGFVIWAMGVHPGFTFLSIYIVISVYILIRYIIYRKVLNIVATLDGASETHYTLLPTLRLFTWGILAYTDDHYKLGRYRGGIVTWSKELKKNNEDNIVIESSKKYHFVNEILEHSKFLHAKVIRNLDGYEVHWFDLRYQYKIDEPYIAVIKLDKQLNLVQSFVKRGLIAAPEKI
ncbi:metal-dependent hydrolase [Evansella sp. AB-rgal1]|uniref:metal-dependent hydrolase n=1 Tax=Evansella sp. AB-rgal1 TaxID=3242696 RepID=UPI00359D503E